MTPPCHLSPDTSLAVYVHWPWCASLCPYCDFDKQASDFGLADEYIDALCAHIASASGGPPRPAHSLYFGGGTPSLLRPGRLARIIEAVRSHLNLLTDAEITVETNPSDVAVPKLRAYFEAGVNRISLGVQSLVDEELRFLGRRHSADKAARAVRALREAGCRNLSIDLMYGLPDQTPPRLQTSLGGILDFEPEHISCYALTLEDSTPMGRDLAEGRLDLPSDDAVAAGYDQIRSGLAEAGYEQYELSNWARPGFASVHNLTYWRNGEYLGLGAGAAGSHGGLRYKRNPDVRAYVGSAKSGDPAFVDSEAWTREQAMRDSVMLGLRLNEGISNAEFCGRYGTSLAHYCTDRLPALVETGVLGWRDDRLCLAPDHFFVCNAVLGEILPSPSNRRAAKFALRESQGERPVRSIRLFYGQHAG